MTLDELKDDGNFLTPADKRRRGFSFETYLFNTFEAQGFTVKRPFKKPGEQIDGGIYFDGAWYLLEAKWHSKELPVSEVYSFKGKVDGKFSGTRGFFISWSGYSNECADALGLGKELNVILCDSSDIERADKDGWDIVFREKLMFASLFGEVYSPESMRRSVKDQETKFHKLEIFVEAERDAEILEAILSIRGLNENVAFVSCSGKMSAIRLASTLPKKMDTKRILVLDSDGNPNQEDELRSLPLVDESISIEPMLEALFYPKSDDPRRDFNVNARRSRQTFVDHARSLFGDLFKNDPQDFIRRLEEAVRVPGA